ncbi:MAG: DHH family phosphoesterase [Candidatus Woesearchaeota archaeon]|jgi:single-stranded DNA-specific DHH superfamily exonuclease|nr:DHH family phosphoesterase [Candidatus Woesearchaeota archaeon]
MLTQKQFQQIRDELDNCQNPIFFFDDDPDGLCAFLLLYRYKKEGHGFVVKTHPKLDVRSAPKIEQYDADKVFVLDVANLEQDFIDASKAPVIWIDHHGPFERTGMRYFNPRINDKNVNIPTTYMCYKVVQQDLWIAMVGCIADYYMPDFLNEFKKKYPDLLNDKKTVGDIYFSSKLGTLIKIFSFCLKGKTSEVVKNMKILTRIESPYEILNQETAKGKFIFKRYEKINKLYDSLLEDAVKAAGKEKMLVFTYSEDKMSFTGDLANELLHKFPDKIIIVGRKKDDDVRMSLRSRNILIPPILEKSLAGLEGYGGGHEYACGANIKETDFKEFVKRIKINAD